MKIRIKSVSWPFLFLPTYIHAITVKPWILVKSSVLSGYYATPYRFNILIRHESIHLLQQHELGILKFIAIYLWYYIERLFDRLEDGQRFGHSVFHAAYRTHPMELEAYNNDRDLNYLKSRKKQAWKIYT